MLIKSKRIYNAGIDSLSLVWPPAPSPAVEIVTLDGVPGFFTRNLKQMSDRCPTPEGDEVDVDLTAASPVIDGHLYEWR